MFNSLAYNCDYKDAIGNTHFLELIKVFDFNFKKYFPGAVNEASYWGSSSPGR